MLASKLRSSRLWKDTRGLTTVEYVILLGLIAVVAVGVWKTLGQNIHDYVDKSTHTIDKEMPAGAKGG